MPTDRRPESTRRAGHALTEELVILRSDMNKLLHLTGKLEDALEQLHDELSEHRGNHHQ